MGKEAKSSDVPPDEATQNPQADSLTVTERSLVRRLSRALRFADLMALLMVAATGLSAFATWRTAEMTNRIFAVAERPYVGIQHVSLEAFDDTSVMSLK
jgi:hypothetical protein